MIEESKKVKEERFLRLKDEIDRARRLYKVLTGKDIDIRWSEKAVNKMLKGILERRIANKEEIRNKIRYLMIRFFRYGKIKSSWVTAIFPK